MLDDGGDPPPRADTRLLLDDERHVDRFVVDEQPVLLLAVVAESFPMIGEQDDRRSIVELVRLQITNQPADDFVGVRDLAIVRRKLREPLGRRVRFVRFVEVKEQERAR